MTLIDEITNDDFKYCFYSGIDFEKAFNHPKDGSEGFMICFVENFLDEKRAYDRELKINSIIYNDSLSDTLENIDNNYMMIYQTGEYQQQVYESVKKKLIRPKSNPIVWGCRRPIGEINRGLF